MNYYELVKEFHLAFGQPVATERIRLADKRHELRMKLIRKEWIETLKAINKEDDEQILDGFIDLVYVVTGYRVEGGLGRTGIELGDHDGIAYSLSEHIGQIDVVHFIHESINRIDHHLEMIQDYIISWACRFIDLEVFEKAFLEVHKSNMAKIWSQVEAFQQREYNRKEIAWNQYIVTRDDGKIMKPPSWKAPNLKQFL